MTQQGDEFTFRSVPSSPSFCQLEKEVQTFWDEKRVEDRALEQRTGAPRYVFFEGPPTANGMPHPGHCLTRAMKDLFPRYQTMLGNLCERKGGWDTHGLPVETEVCKELGIHSKAEIEEYGIEPFVRLSPIEKACHSGSIPGVVAVEGRLITLADQVGSLAPLDYGQLAFEFLRQCLDEILCKDQR